MNRKSLIFLATGTLAAAAITGTALATDKAPARTGSPAISTDVDPMPAAADDATQGPTDDATSDPTDDATPSATRTTEGAGPAAGRTSVDSDRAGEIALARIGGGTVVEVEREVEHGRSVWSVKIVQGGQRHRVDVDAQTGRVVRVESDGVDDRGSGRDDRGSGRDDRARDDKGGDDHGRYDD